MMASKSASQARGGNALARIIGETSPTSFPNVHTIVRQQKRFLLLLSLMAFHGRRGHMIRFLDYFRNGMFRSKPSPG